MTIIERDINLSLTNKRKFRSAAIYGGPVFLVCVALFYFFPEVDLATSKAFFDSGLSEDGKPIRFGFASSEGLKFFFWLIDVIARVVLVASIALTVYFAFKKHRKLLSATIVTFSLILGPAVVVNAVFKDHWDRARPRQIIEFGGDKKFTPAWVVSNQCQRNCSFTSGHAAAGFAFVVGHFVSKGKLWLFLGLITGSIIGITRVMVGAHFLSDVVFSFFAVYFVAALVAFILFRLSEKRRQIS